MVLISGTMMAARGQVGGVGTESEVPGGTVDEGIVHAAPGVTVNEGTELFGSGVSGIVDDGSVHVAPAVNEGAADFGFLGGSGVGGFC